MTLRRSLSVLVAVLSLSRPQSALAAPGDYDTAFAGVGFTRIDFGPGESRANALALSGDGTLIVAGDQKNADWDFAIARLLSNGSLDPTFSGDGGLVLPIDVHDHARDVCLQADGRIVVAGYSGLSHLETLVLVRLLADGSLDASFDGDGILTSRLGLNDGGTALAIQPDGRIVVTGWSLDDFDAYRVRVSRYLSNGQPDSSFGNDGHFFHDFGSVDTTPQAIALQPDGRIVVVGYRLVSGSTTHTLILRLTAGGVLDNSFSGDGWDARTILSGFNFLFDVAVQPDGKIVAVGSTAAGAGSDHCVLRYRADGTLDPDFDGDGIARFDLGASEGSDHAVALDSTGQILTAGSHQNSSLDQSVFRLHPDGSLDNAWGGTGHVFLDPLGGAVDEARAIVVDSNDRAVVAGWSDSRMCVARLAGTETTLAAPDTEIGTDLGAAAPWPNPTSSWTALSLHVGESGRVRVELFDVSGRLVRRVFEQNVSAGPRIVTWDLRDDAGRPVTNGLYLARITTPAGAAVRRIAVSR